MATEICEGFIDVDDERLYCELPATGRVMGEQDSFGVEWVHLCDTCTREWYDMLAAHAEEMRIGNCEWCKQPATDRRDFHGWEQERWEDKLVCGACRDRDRKELNAELDSMAEQEEARQAARRPVESNPFGSQEPTDGYW